MRIYLLVFLIFLSSMFINNMNSIYIPQDNDQYVFPGIIYIDSDGSIYPIDAPIDIINDTYYMLTKDIWAEEILIFRDNIVFDGNNHLLNLSEGITLYSDNFTLKNTYIHVRMSDWGINGRYGYYISLINNTILNSYGAAQFYSSVYIVFANNRVINTTYGFEVYDSINISIENNTFINNLLGGILIEPYTWYYGQQYIHILNNKLINSYITLLTYSDFKYEFPLELIIDNNTIDGKPILFLKNIGNKTFSHEEYGEIIVYNVTNILFKDILVEVNRSALIMISSNNITFNNLVFNITNPFNMRLYSLFMDYRYYERSFKSLISPINSYIGASTNIRFINSYFNNTLTIVDASCNISFINNEFHSKTPYNGILSISSCNISFINNSFINGGIGILDTQSFTIINNTVNNKPIVVFKNLINDTIDGDYGQIILYNSSNVELTNLNITDTLIALNVISSRKISILNNVFSDLFIGLSIYNSDMVFVKNSVLNNNYVGLYIEDTKSSYILENNITNNLCGVFTKDNLGVIFCLNNFINNTLDTFGSSYGTIWSCPYPIGGNYWDQLTCFDLKHGPDQDRPGGDGICEATKYVYAGGDKYPLSKPYTGIYKGFIVSFDPLIDLDREELVLEWKIMVKNGDGVWRIILVTPTDIITRKYNVTNSPNHINDRYTYHYSEYMILDQSNNTRIRVSIALIGPNGKIVDYNEILIDLTRALKEKSLPQPTIPYKLKPREKHTIEYPTNTSTTPLTNRSSITGNLTTKTQTIPREPNYTSILLAVISIISLTIYVLLKKTKTIS